jgi:glycosyltransferase involved in cell wall biosynthesis
VLKLKPYISDPKEVSKMLQHATISIVPARRFALPNVAIESQLCGTPVVALNTGGNHEIITPTNGLLMSSLSPILFAQAVEKLLSDKSKYMQFATQGSLRSKRMFDASKQCTKISDLYMSMLYG